jgi:hypothetical protein
MYWETKVIVWICIALFAATAVIAVLALIGMIRLGRTNEAHDHYLRRLFVVLIVEVAAISISAFAAQLRDPSQYAPNAIAKLENEVRELKGQIGQKVQSSPSSKWTFIKLDDCSGRDVNSTGGELPKDEICSGAARTAVCWDGKLYQNGGGAWCTYKSATASACSGGSRPGRMFSCSP